MLRFISEKKKLEFDLYLISEQMYEDMAEQYPGGAEKAIEEAMEMFKGGDIELEDTSATEENVNEKETSNRLP